MQLLMVAAPGAGKGTQAARLAAHYGLTHLASGDLFRHEVAAGTPFGRLAQSYLAAGDLVPDDVVLEMILGRIAEAAQTGGYVLDGFPRTLHQAQAAHEAASRMEGVDLEAVLHLIVDRPELKRRMLSRGRREGRSDDNEATIEHRLDVYEQQTEPLLSFYADQGLVVDIDGSQPPDAVFATIVDALDQRAAQLA